MDAVAPPTIDALYERLKTVISLKDWTGYTEDLSAILRLKQERNAIILAHNYMTPEIFHGVADIVGDSLALAREAAQTQADVIVVAGVHFMAETAKLLNPARKVLMPDPDAGCSLSDSITAHDVRALRQKHPHAPVVTYVNTSAAVKAESDICCTSANALKIVESMNAPDVIMLPDEYLAQNTAAKTGINIITWHGHCEVHERFTPEDVQTARAAHPGLTVLAHPECPPNVMAKADAAGSTAQMIDWIETRRPSPVMLLTEASMSDNVAAQYPDLRFIRPCLTCPHMKRITLKNIRNVLETMTNEVLISEDLAARARKAVERMIAVK